MGLDFVRNNSARCPPVLVLGLMVMSFLLLCNRWLLSSQNSELLKQIDDLADQLRINGKQLDKCSQQEILLNEKLKDSQSRFIKQQMIIEQIKESESDVKEGYEKLKEELNIVKQDCSGKNVQKQLKTCLSERSSLLKWGESKVLTKEASETEKLNLMKDMTGKNAVVEYLKDKLNSTKIITGKMPNIGASLINELQEKARLVSEKSGSQNQFQGREKDQDGDEEEEELKNYGDSSIVPLENVDPREQAMKAF